MVRKLPKTTDGNQYIVTLVFQNGLRLRQPAETFAMFLYEVICRYVLHVLIHLLLKLMFIIM